MKAQKKYWLIKSEGSCYSIDDFARDKITPWTGVRNFQARNFMRDMQIGDRALFYHSSSSPTGVFGVAEVCATARADETALDKNDEHHDPRSTKENPIWICPDLKFISKFKAPVTLETMKCSSPLTDMRALQRGNRLSVMPVTREEFEEILNLAQKQI